LEVKFTLTKISHSGSGVSALRFALFALNFGLALRFAFFSMKLTQKIAKNIPNLRTKLMKSGFLSFHISQNFRLRRRKRKKSGYLAFQNS